MPPGAALPPILLATVDSVVPWHAGALSGLIVRPVPDPGRLRDDVRPVPAVVVAPDGTRQAVLLRFARVHYSRRRRGLPAWESECLVQGASAIEPGAAIRCERALLRRPRPLDPEAFWRRDRPDLSERAYRRLLALCSARPPVPSPRERRLAVPRRAELLAWLARALAAQGRHAEAWARLDEAGALITMGPFGDALRVPIERGRLALAAGDEPQARVILERAWERALAYGETASALETAYLLAKPSPAQERAWWYTEALALADAAHDARSRRWRPVLYAVLGDARRALGDEDAARAALETTAELRRITRSPWQPE